MSSARRRALGLAFGVRAAFAFLAAWPAVREVSFLIGPHPLADALLWEPGGFRAVDVFHGLRHASHRLALEVGGVALLGLLVWSLALGVLVSAHRKEESAPLAMRGRRGVGRGVTFAVLGVGEALARVLLVAFSAAFVGFAARLMTRDPRAEWPFVLGAALGGAFAWGGGLLVELVRARTAWHDEPLSSAFATAWSWLLARPAPLVRAALARSLVTALGLALVSRAVFVVVREQPTCALFLVLVGASIPVVARDRFYATLAANPRRAVPFSDAPVEEEQP